MEEPERQQIGRLVIDARERKGWSQERLAQEAGVSPNTILGLEKGLKKRPGVLRAVLDALGIDPEMEGPRSPTFGLEIETVRNLIGLYLEGLEPGQPREDAVRRILHALPPPSAR